MDYSFIIECVYQYSNIKDSISLKLTQKNISKKIKIRNKVKDYMRNKLRIFYNVIISNDAKNLNFKHILNKKSHPELFKIILKTEKNKIYYNLFIDSIASNTNTLEKINNIDISEKDIYHIILNEFIYHNNNKNFKKMSKFESFIASICMNLYH